MEASKQSNTLDIKYLNLVRFIISKRYIPFARVIFINPKPHH